MELITDWKSSFDKVKTKKAKKIHSKIGRLLLRVMEFFTGECLCEKCNMSHLVRECPGEFRDFDADDEQGGDGIPLCSGCLGTDKFQKTPEFKKLQREVRRIRTESFALQIKASKEKKWDDAFKVSLESYNNQLITIAKRGLELVKYPNKNCLAIRIVK